MVLLPTTTSAEAIHIYTPCIRELLQHIYALDIKGENHDTFTANNLQLVLEFEMKTNLTI